jgi:alkaline phosphatase D
LRISSEADVGASVGKVRHSTWFSALQVDFDKPESPSVAVEFTATSVSSDFPIAFDTPIKAVLNPAGPVLRRVEARGYLRATVGRHTWRTDVRTVDTIAVRTAPVSTSASFVVEAGSSTLVKA